MATSVGRGLRVKRVDDSLLQCGVAIMPGGVDQLGRPLVTFPTTTPDMLRQRHTTAHLVLLLRYYVMLTDMVTHHGGMAVIANLTTFSAKDALQMVVDSLDKLQAEICGSVGIMYAILPRSKDAQKSLKKLLGLKPSKKHPKMPTYEVILLEGVADLQRYVQRRHLTSDFGGTMTYNHRIWAQLTKDIEDLAEDVTSSLGRVPDALDKVAMMSEYDLPASPSENEALLLQVRSKYNDVMCDLNLEHLIDECKSLNEKLSAPHKYEGYNDITQTVTFTEAKVKVIDYRNRLVKARESLKLLWQQAERRLMLSSKVNKYKVKAEKVTEWMQGVGLPTVNQEPDIADCLSKAEILKNHFETGFLAIAQNVLWLAEKILKKFESVLQECSPSKPSSSSQTSSQTTHLLQKAAVLAYTRQFQATVEYFKRAVEKKHQVYVNVHAFFLGAVKASNAETETNLSIYRQLQQLTKWYRRTLSFLPVQLLVPVSQTSAGPPNRAAAYTSAAWRVAVEDFLLHQPLPPPDKLSKMKNVIPVIDNIGIRNQARLLISRITVIRLLLVTPEHLTLHDLQDVLAWRDQVTKGQDEIYLNMTTSTLDLSRLTDVAYNNYSQKGNLSEREHQPRMESKVESSSTSDNAVVRTPKLRLGNGNARVCFDEQLTDDIQSAHAKNGHLKEHRRPPLVPKLDLRSIKSPVTQQSPFQRGQFLERQRSFGIYGDVDDPEKMAQRRRRRVCAIPHGDMAVDAGGGVAGAQQSITKELYDVAGPQQSVTKELYGVARARQLVTKELCYVAGAQQSVTEENSGVAGVQQTVSKELYVSLGGAEASSGSAQLPVSLKHINLNALEKNLPQAKENVEQRTMQPTATSHNMEHRKERLHSYESLVDSGIANMQSSTEGSGVSDSTTGLSPNLSVGHRHANTLQESNGRSPERGHPEHRTQSRNPRVQGHEITVIQESDHVIPDQCDLSMKQPNQIHRNHDNSNKSRDQRQSQLLQAKSLPDLTYEQNGRLSLVQNNVDIIVNSALSPEEKLKLMATMCECDSVHSGSNVSADPISAPLLALANGSARLDDEAGLVHGRGSVSYNRAGRLSEACLLNSSLTSFPGGGAATQNEAGPVSSSPSHFPQTPKPKGARLTSPEASPASLHPDQIAPSVTNPQGHQQHQQSIHHQGHMDPEQQQIATCIRDYYKGKAADQVQIQNGRQPGPAEAFLLTQHAQGFGGGCEKGTAHAPGLGIDIEAWMMMNQEDGGRRLLLTEVSDREQAENGMAEYVEKWRHAQDSREAEEEDLVQARTTLEDLRVQEEQFKQQVVEDSLTRTEQLLQEQEDHLRQQKKMILEPADDFLPTSECSLSSGTHTSDGYPLPRSPGSPPPHPDALYRSSRSVSPPRAAVYDSSASAESGVFTLNSADWQLIKASRSEPQNCEEGSGAQPRTRWLGCAAGSALMMTPDELLQARAALSEKSGRVGAAAGQAAKSGVVRQMDFRDMIKSTRTGSDGKNDGDDEHDEGNEDVDDDKDNEGNKDIMDNDGNEDIRGNEDIVDYDGNGDIEDNEGVEDIGDNEGFEDIEDIEGNEDAADIEGNENIEGDEDIDGDEDIEEEDDRQDHHHHHDHHRDHYDGCDDHDDHEDERCEQLTASLQVKHADFHSPKQGLQDRCDESRGNLQVNGTADLGAGAAEPNSLPSTASASPETIESGSGSVFEKGGDVEVTGEGAVLPGEEGGECVPDGRDHRHHHRHQHQHHHRQMLDSGSSTPADPPSPPPSQTGSPGETPLQKWHSIDWSVMDDGSIQKPQKDVNENLTGWGCGLEEAGSVDGVVNEKELIVAEEEEELVVPRTECATRTDAVHQAATSVARAFMRDVRDEEGGTVVHGCTELGDVKVKVAHGGGVSAWSKALPLPSYSMEFLNLKTPVIIDNGSGMCKCGFADQDRPSAIFPALVGRAKYEDVSVGRMEEHYVGLDAQSMRGVLKLHYPLEHGIITDWNDMELIWQHAFREELRIDPAEHPVLVTEAPLNPKKNREHMMELLFETFQVPGVYFAVQAVLALYASGRTTGMVMDSGDGVSHFVPIYEGYSLPHAVQRLDLAGRDLTQYMATLFHEKGVSFTSSAEREILREIKEQHCYITQDYCADMQRAETSAAMEEFYTLPDGSSVSLTTERFRCPELLFDPTVIGHEPGGVHVSSYKSIMKCDFDLRKQLFSNIVLSGGTTMLPGFGARLQAEVSALAPSGVAGSVHVTSPDDRYFSVWQGGAVLASLPTFHDSWISYEEYLDVGSNIVHLKCF